MRILFVYPDNNPSYPLQIGAISAYLKERGHETKLLMPLMKSGALVESRHLDEIFGEIQAFSPDYVGFTGYETALPWIRQIARYVKNHFPQVQTVLGGYFPTMQPNEAIRMPEIDIICLNEGERPMAELLDSEGLRRDIPGLWFKDEHGTPIPNPIGPVLEDLDELPWPDRDMLDYQAHLNYEPVGERCIKVMAGRGCIYQCTYCGNWYIRANLDRKSKKKYFRLRSPEDVVAELKHLKSRYEFEKVGFHDDIFWSDKQWLRDFVPLYKQDVGTPYYCATRVELCDDETLALLRDSGCYLLLMGVESGDERFRGRILKRGMTNDSTVSVFRRARERGILTWSFTMVGMPYETFGMMLRTIWFNWICRPDFVQCSIFYPLRGTDMGEMCYKENWVDLEKRDRVTSYAWDTILKHPSVARWLWNFIHGQENPLLPRFVIRAAKYANIFTAARNRLFWRLLANRIMGRWKGEIAEVVTGETRKVEAWADVPEMERKS